MTQIHIMSGPAEETPASIDGTAAYRAERIRHQAMLKQLAEQYPDQTSPDETLSDLEIQVDGIAASLPDIEFNAAGISTRESADDAAADLEIAAGELREAASELDRIAGALCDVDLPSEDDINPSQADA
jgi:hypothetical protein